MEIFNRIPAISEDTLHFAIYLPENLADHTSATTLAASIQSFTETLLPPDFLWHRDAFETKVVSNPDSESKEYMIEGHMRVGDCVDDEWCTVWLLKEISAKWDVAIKVSDSDGDFLLIEAADVLPRWVKPTNSDNRVWIHDTRLHLIDISYISPPSRKPRRNQNFPRGSDDEDDGSFHEESEDYLAVEDALKLIRDPTVDTIADPAMEQVVWNRISGYPQAARQHIHSTKAYIPLDIAKALSVSPSLVQRAVEAFYTRDGVQIRAAHRMSRFPPHTFVLATVKLTRTAYAQLVGQKFYPPKIFGRWEEREGTREWRWRDIGMKIAVGFEILYQETKGRSEINTSAEGLRASTEAKKDALRRNSEYNQYIENLLSTGYFKGEMQGSQLWTQLETKAADMFVNVRKDESSARPSFTMLVNSAISQVSDDFQPVIQEEDSDDWLNIDAENFEDMLQQQPHGTSDNSNLSHPMDVDPKATEGSTSPRTSQLRNLASKVEEFIQGEGDVEGARFADEEFSDEEMNDEDSDDEPIEDDPNARQIAMDNLVPKLDPSEYGKMPASYHSNSQRVGPSAVESDTGKPDSEKAQVPGTQKPIRQPILPRDTYDGVDSDDETDEENAVEDSESEEDKPQVVGDIEVDMGEEEDEFLEFSRQALGISDSQWKDILEERRTRGAFVPNIVSPSIKLPTTEQSPSHQKPDGTPASGPNPNLDSFEAVMKAMEDELHRSRSSLSSKSASKTTSHAQAGEKGKAKDKGKGKAVSFAQDSSDDEDVDIEAAMEAELKAALESGDDVDEDGLGTADIDYNLIKNFLESLKSQAGASGPVSNLAGRLQPGWQMPKDI